MSKLLSPEKVHELLMLDGVSLNLIHTIEAAVLEAQGKQEPVAEVLTGYCGPDRVVKRLTSERDFVPVGTLLYAAPVVQPDMVMEGFKAACAFIDSHVANPDITSEMRKTYAEFMRMRAMIAAAEVKSNAEGKPTPDQGGRH